nr:unnamed protein product [Callosobruchus analis]
MESTSRLFHWLIVDLTTTTINAIMYSAYGNCECKIPLYVYRCWHEW